MRRSLPTATAAAYCYCLLTLSLLFSACSSSRRFTRQVEKQVIASPVFNRAFTGFTLLDPETGKTLADVNGDKYFTPASNTKILTLATCLEVLRDSVPGVQYFFSDDSLVMWYRGTGDPAFLNPYFNYWRYSYLFLKKSVARMLVPVDRYFPTSRFGAGWAWDDYNEAYQTERSPFPIYGNLARFECDSAGRLTVYPFSFQRFTRADTSLENISILRKEHTSEWIYAPQRTYPGLKVSVPFFTNDDPNGLLGDTLKLLRGQPESDTFTARWRTLYSVPLDTVLRRMMYQSDNFIAEQMLLVCAGQKFDLLQQDTVIKWMLDSALTHLPQRPRWVDGSGLSRYNLASPRDLVAVLDYLWKSQPRQRLFSLFNPAGAPDTTLEWYKATPGARPYLFAKTGSMSGVNCLSGYLVCNSGKVLIFSFMHNNYVGTNKPWKAEMQRILEFVRENH